MCFGIIVILDENDRHVFFRPVYCPCAVTATDTRNVFFGNEGNQFLASFVKSDRVIRINRIAVAVPIGDASAVLYP